MWFPNSHVWPEQRFHSTGSTPDPHLSTEDGVFKDHNASARPEDVLRMPARIVPLGMNKNCTWGILRGDGLDRQNHGLQDSNGLILDELGVPAL